MFYHIAFGCLLTLIIIAMGFLLENGFKKTLYNFENVNLCALIFCLLLFLTFIISDGIINYGKGEFNCIVRCFKLFPEFFAHISVWGFLILGILMFISNISLIHHEGMKPTNMVGTFLGVIVVGATLCAYALSVMFEYLDSLKGITFISEFLPLFFYCFVDYCDCIIVGIIVMGYVAAKQKPKYDKDFIIILGCSISKNGGLRPLLKGRTNRAIKYAWNQEIATGKKVCFVPTGGQGKDEIMSEGSAMELYLLSHAAETDEVFPEKESRNTEENFAFSYKIIKEQKENAKIAFATTNYHMFRSGLIAKQVGIDAEGIASATKWYFWPNGFAREVVALFNMTKKQHFISGILLIFLSILIAFAI